MFENIIIFHFSLLSGESVGTCNGAPSTARSSLFIVTSDYWSLTERYLTKLAA